MKINRKIVGKNLLIAGGGAVASLIFPPFDNAWFGHIALIFFLGYLFSDQFSLKKLFADAYLFGFTFYIIGYSWICQALLVDDDKFVAYIPLVLIAIGAFFALFWALPAMAIYFGKNIYARVLFFCGAFVFMEWVRSFIFTGFPWNLLGTALGFDVRLIQGAAYVGTYGLSLLLLMLCCGIAILLFGLMQKKLHKGALCFVFVPLLFIAVAMQRYAVGQCLHCDEVKDFVVRLVQPSIPQTFKWDPQLMENNFQQHVKMSQKGQEEGYLPLNSIRMVVWGETASPYLLDRDIVHLSEIKKAIPQDGFLVTGSLRMGRENGKNIPYNSLFVINHNGEIKDYYDKSHLVPFGEFLPFRQYLPDFMEPVANVVGDLGRGEKYKNIRVDGLPLMGGAICYESIFPKEVLNPKEKPEILFVLANDGWYGISAGPYQHLVAAQMRAVEEGVTVIRGANTGISAVIAPDGQIRAKIGLNESGIVDVVLSVPFAIKTMYGQYGNGILFVLLLICFGIGWLLNLFYMNSCKAKAK